MTIYLKGVIRWRNEEDSLLSLKQKLCLKLLAVKVHRRNCVAAITSAKPKSQRGNGPFLENAETFFEAPEKRTDASVERIAQLEQLVGRLTLALEIQKKASTLLD